jgi:hypothetical protein
MDVLDQFESQLSCQRLMMEQRMSRGLRFRTLKPACIQVLNSDQNDFDCDIQAQVNSYSEESKIEVARYQIHSLYSGGRVQEDAMGVSQSRMTMS